MGDFSRFYGFMARKKIMGGGIFSLSFFLSVLSWSMEQPGSIKNYHTNARWILLVDDT